jgi:integrase/recombinase XerD
MSALAPTLQAFFTQRLMAQRHASAHTVAAYRDTFRLLLGFVEEQAGKRPAALNIQDLDAPRISAFLDHLERSRGNTVRTRNARLATIHSLFRFAALRHPEHAELIQRVLAIPPKRFERKIVSFLSDDEVEALLAAPDRSTFLGRRDHALLVTAIQTGLRVTELIGLRVHDVVLGTGAHVRCLGKGRKERATPLTPQTAEMLRSWLKERGGAPPDPVFPTTGGTALSRYGVSAIVTRHAGAATACCPSLATKTASPHVLRHTAAMRLLHAGVDTTVIALWLGHESVESTQIYVHADLGLKEKALARITPIGAMPGRYRPPDKLLAFLEAL